MSTKDRPQNSDSVSKGIPVFQEVPTESASKYGITLQIDEECLKELEELRERSAKAYLERKEYLWR